MLARTTAAWFRNAIGAPSVEPSREPIESRGLATILRATALPIADAVRARMSAGTRLDALAAIVIESGRGAGLRVERRAIVIAALREMQADLELDEMAKAIARIASPPDDGKMTLIVRTLAAEWFVLQLGEPPARS